MKPKPNRRQCYRCGRRRAERLMWQAPDGHWYCEEPCPIRNEWREIGT